MSKVLILAGAVAAIAALAYSRNQAEEQQQPPQEPPVNTADSPAPVDPDAPGVDPEKVDWSKVDWRKRLTADEFHILRRAGTERAFTGEYWDFFKEGQYKCRGCGLPLFESESKFNAHCGWPSFDRVIADNAVVEIEDASHGMRRIEVRCRRCGGHLGHVFDDGPTDTGLRYCMNSASIKFDPEQPAEQRESPPPDAAPAPKP